jgi:hypothetical protein
MTPTLHRTLSDMTANTCAVGGGGSGKELICHRYSASIRPLVGGLQPSTPTRCAGPCRPRPWSRHVLAAAFAPPCLSAAAPSLHTWLSGAAPALRAVACGSAEARGGGGRAMRHSAGSSAHDAPPPPRRLTGVDTHVSVHAPPGRDRSSLARQAKLRPWAISRVDTVRLRSACAMLAGVATQRAPGMRSACDRGLRTMGARWHGDAHAVPSWALASAVTRAR